MPRTVKAWLSLVVIMGLALTVARLSQRQVAAAGGSPAIDGVPGCTQWNVTGTWTAYLGVGGRGATFEPVLALTQTGSNVSIAVTSDPSTAGQNFQGKTYSGTVSGSSISFTLPWDETGTPNPSAPGYTGKISAYQIIDSAFSAWSLGGNATCTSQPSPSPSSVTTPSPSRLPQSSLPSPSQPAQTALPRLSRSPQPSAAGTGPTFPSSSPGSPGQTSIFSSSPGGIFGNNCASFSVAVAQTGCGPSPSPSTFVSAPPAQSLSRSSSPSPAGVPVTCLDGSTHYPSAGDPCPSPSPSPSSAPPASPSPSPSGSATACPATSAPGSRAPAILGLADDGSQPAPGNPCPTTTAATASPPSGLPVTCLDGSTHYPDAGDPCPSTSPSLSPTTTGGTEVGLPPAMLASLDPRAVLDWQNCLNGYPLSQWQDATLTQQAADSCSAQIVAGSPWALVLPSLPDSLNPLDVGAWNTCLNGSTPAQLASDASRQSAISYCTGYLAMLDPTGVIPPSLPADVDPAATAQWNACIAQNTPTQLAQPSTRADITSFCYGTVIQLAPNPPLPAGIDPSYQGAWDACIQSYPPSNLTAQAARKAVIIMCTQNLPQPASSGGSAPSTTGTGPTGSSSSPSP